MINDSHPLSFLGDRDPRMGVFYILLSCIVQGTQYVYEEKVMTHFDAHPLVVVGMEVRLLFQLQNYNSTGQSPC